MANTTTGASMTQSPYLLPSLDGVTVTSILTAGDHVPGWTTTQGLPWRFTGTPDGIGAYDNGDGTVTILVNHEIGATNGLLHAHGAPGAFVSELVIDLQTFEVVAAGDLAHRMFLYDTGAHPISTGHPAQP